MTLLTSNTDKLESILKLQEDVDDIERRYNRMGTGRNLDGHFAAIYDVLNQEAKDLSLVIMKAKRKNG